MTFLFVLSFLSLSLFPWLIHAEGARSRFYTNIATASQSNFFFAPSLSPSLPPLLREIWVYSVNLLEGLAALHAKGVCHRDLKPANCLIDQHGCVKIADMNISKVSKGGDGGMMQTQVGTPYFICPEIYLKRPYSSTSDMWSLGGVLYNLAALHPPFLADK